MEGRKGDPLIIGKKQESSVFQRCEKFSLEWTSNKKAWITTDIISQIQQQN